MPNGAKDKLQIRNVACYEQCILWIICKGAKKTQPGIQMNYLKDFFSELWASDYVHIAFYRKPDRNPSQLWWKHAFHCNVKKKNQWTKRYCSIHSKSFLLWKTQTSCPPNGHFRLKVISFLLFNFVWEQFLVIMKLIRRNTKINAWWVKWCPSRDPYS